MTPADRIIGKFGGIRRMSARLTDTPPSTIQGWRLRGTIPVRRAPEILAAGADLPDPIRPHDFIPEDSVAPVDLPPSPRARTRTEEAA